MSSAPQAASDGAPHSPLHVPVPGVSVVVPVHNEEENVATLIGEIAAALDGRDYEMVFVDDRSTDGTRAALARAREDHACLRILAHVANAGQSRAVRSGVLGARAPVVCVLDGDGQNDPADLPAMIDALLRDGAPDRLAMVMGRRRKRKDSAWKRFGSWFGNSIRKSLLKDETDDAGCGIKVFRREAFLLLPYFDHMHRFMSALMLREGFQIEFVDVNHRPRQHGRSKYTNWGRLRASIADLWGVMWLRSRSRAVRGVEEV